MVDNLVVPNGMTPYGKIYTIQLPEGGYYCTNGYVADTPDIASGTKYRGLAETWKNQTGGTIITTLNGEIIPTPPNDDDSPENLARYARLH